MANVGTYVSYRSVLITFAPDVYARLFLFRVPDYEKVDPMLYGTGTRARLAYFL
jgi:hypothetical protein